MVLQPDRPLEQHDSLSTKEHHDELDTAGISLQEQIALEEIALKALLDRKSQVNHQLVSEEQKVHRLQTQRVVLQEQKVTLQEAHTQHLSLRDKLQESLIKSHEKLSKLEKIEAVQEMQESHQGGARVPATSSVNYAATLEALDDTTIENDDDNDNVLGEEETSRHDSEGNGSSEPSERLVLRVSILDPLALHSYYQQQQQPPQGKPLQSNSGFRPFLPMVDSKLVSKIMEHYQMETMVLDRPLTISDSSSFCNDSTREEDRFLQDSSASERVVQEAMLRRNLLRNTCLDLLNFRSHTEENDPKKIHLFEPLKDRQPISSSQVTLNTSSESATGISAAMVTATTAAKAALLDPNIPLCPYELAGVCADEHCPYQHTDRNRRHAPILPREVLPLPALNLSKTTVEAAKGYSTSKKPVTRAIPPAMQRLEGMTTKDPTPESNFPEEANQGDNEGQQEKEEEEEEFMTLPAMDEEMDEDMDIDDTESSSDDEDAGVVESYLQEKEKKSCSFWWSNQDIDVFSSPDLPLEDVLKTLGSIKMISDDSGKRQLEFSLPNDGSSRVEWIGWLGRLVDCCRIAVHAGRHDLALAILDASPIATIESTSHADNDSSLSHTTGHDREEASKISVMRTLDNHKLNPIVQVLHRIRLAAYKVDSLQFCNLRTTFSVQISFAILSQYLESLLLLESESNPSSPQAVEAEASENFTVVLKTVELLLGTNAHPAQSTIISPIRGVQSFFPPKTAANEQAGNDKFQALQAVVLWSLCTLRGDSATFQSIPVTKLEAGLLKPIWNIISIYFHKEKVFPNDYLRGIAVMGFMLLSCLECFANHVERGKDSLGPSLTAALTSIDFTINHILKNLGKLVHSNAQLLSLTLTPLVAASIASASFLQQYLTAQNRLATVILRNQLSRSKWMQYSDLLWSQLMHLRMSLPVDSEMGGDSSKIASVEKGTRSSSTENDKLVRLMEMLGVRLNHMSLLGDSNLTDHGNRSDVEAELVSKASETIRQLILDQNIGKAQRGPVMIDLSNVELSNSLDVGMGDRSQWISSSMPRSIQLATQCVELVLQNCRLTALPPSFGLEFMHMIRLDVSYNSLSRLPLSIVSMTCLQELQLSHNILTELPELPGSNLRLLDVSSNRLSRFPAFLLPDMTNGKSMAPGTSIPTRKKRKLQMDSAKTISRFQKLEELVLTHNCLDHIDMIRSKLILNLKNLRSLEIE
ncbi:MAG: hypothetical protein SGBAC_005001 [Bacillariaceae sp.]